MNKKNNMGMETGLDGKTLTVQPLSKNSNSLTSSCSNQSTAPKSFSDYSKENQELQELKFVLAKMENKKLEKKCDACNGTGKQITPDKSVYMCPKCRGTGVCNG